MTAIDTDSSSQNCSSSSSTSTSTSLLSSPSPLLVPLEHLDKTIATTLRVNSGVAVVDLSSSTSFVFGPSLDILRDSWSDIERLAPRIPFDTTLAAAHVTGFHSPDTKSLGDGVNVTVVVNSNAWSSRYNQHRQGWVGSDANDCNGIPGVSDPVNEAALAVQLGLHQLAEQVLVSIERQLQLPQDNWFQQELGPTRSHSQWHLKQYVLGTTKESSTTTTEEEPLLPVELLPSHTDPSLLSVIVLDRPGKQPGAQGLEYFHSAAASAGAGAKHGGEWRSLPCSGHSVAIVLVGSVLSHITGGYYPAARHRVILDTTTTGTGSTDNNFHRMAATLFLRPAGNSNLQVPPSPLLQSFFLSNKMKSNVTFEQWNAKVSRNYAKRQTKKKSSNNNNNNKGMMNE